MKQKKAFNNGLSQIKVSDVRSVRNELMHLLGISNRTTWGLCKNGKFVNRPTPAEIEAIEKTFKKYGVNEPWG